MVAPLGGCLRRSSIQAILFDMDGVLVDSFNAWFQVMVDTAEALGFPPMLREQVEQSWGQSVEADIESFYPGQTVESVVAQFDRFLPQRLDRVVEIEGAKTAFAGLRELGVRVGVVTNSPRQIAHGILDEVGLHPDVVVSGDEVPEAKPAPDMVVKACETLDVPVTAAAMVGDTEYDRQAAEAAGVRFFSFRFDGRDRLDHLEELLVRLSGSSRG